MKLITNFQMFINEAELTDDVIVSKLDRVVSLRDKMKSIKSEMQEIESELKEFDAVIKPFFDMMKELDDKLALTEKYVIKITKYGHTRTDVGWKTVVDQSLEQVDEAARSIIKGLIESNKKLVDVKFSYDIEQLNEASFVEKFKSSISKAMDKFMGLFRKKISTVDSANAKLEKIAASAQDWSDGAGY